PGGVAIMVLTATDNRNRTTAEIRHVFSKYGGNLGSSGCVSYMFERVGYIEIPKESISEEELYEKAIEAGAEDIQTGETHYIVYTKPEDLYSVKDALVKAGITVENASINYKPLSTVQITDPETAKKLIKLLDALDDLDDVQAVISNFDIPEEVLREST
ncbi:MAG: YebC/PmpR family DNA-binding transcriptional regulator, partial [Hydrogenobacter sp.]